MGIFDGILLLSDCDGTLTDNRLQISKKNQEAIRYFQENGGRFTVATGRYPTYITGFSAAFTPNAPIVASNGALLYDLPTDTLVDTIALTHQSLGLFRQVIAFMFALPTVEEIFLGGVLDNACAFVRAGICHADLWAGSVQITNVEEIFAYLDAAQPLLVRAFFTQNAAHTRHNMKLLQQRFGQDFSIVASWDRGIECLAANCSKGNMALKLKAQLGNIHTMVAVGDYHNDIDLFKAADIGYAVANAPDFVKEQADRITVSNEEGAIAAVVADLEKDVANLTNLPV